MAGKWVFDAEVGVKRAKHVKMKRSFRFWSPKLIFLGKYRNVFKVTVNVFWVKIYIFRLRHILLAELSRHTIIPCLKPTEILRMEESLTEQKLLMHQRKTRNIEPP